MVIATIFCGPSQTGKSTLLNLLAGEDVAAMGDGDGNSVTSLPHTHETRIGMVQEIPGYFDSRLQVNNSETAVQSASQLVSNGVDRVRFALFDSLSGDTIQLRSTVSELVRQFGDGVKGSILVLATKRDRASDNELPIRLDAIRAIMNELGIGDNLVIWQNKVSSGEIITGEALDRQLQELNDAIEATDPVVTAELQRLEDRIQERARKLCAEQVPELVSKTEMVLQDHFVPIEYQEPYETTVNVIQRESLLNCDWCWRHVEAIVGSCLIITGTVVGMAAPNAKLFGLCTGGTGGFLLGDAIHEKVTEKKVTKTMYKTAIRYENQPRENPIVLEVERFRKIEGFVLQARDEILEEIRAENAALG